MLSFPAPSIIMKERTTLLQNAACRKTFLHISQYSFISRYVVLSFFLCVCVCVCVCVCTLYSTVNVSVWIPWVKSQGPFSSKTVAGVCVCLCANMLLMVYEFLCVCVCVCVSDCIPMGLCLNVLFESVCDCVLHAAM